MSNGNRDYDRLSPRNVRPDTFAVTKIFVGKRHYTPDSAWSMVPRSIG